MFDLANRVEGVSATLDDAAATPTKRVALGVIASILALVSVSAMVIGVGSADAQKFVISVGIGALFGAGALLILGKMVEAATVGWADRKVVAVGGAIAVVGIAITIFGVTVANSWPADLPVVPMFGLVVMIVGLLVAGRRADDSVTAQPLGWLIAGLALTVAAALPVVVGPSPTGRWVVSISVWVVGITLFKLSLTPWIEAAGDADAIHTRAVLVIKSCAPALAVAILLVIFGNDGRLFIAAAWLIALALSADGLAGLLLTTVWTKSIAAFGALLLAGGVVLLWLLLPAWFWLAVIVGGVAATIGAFYVFRGEGVVAVVLIGALLAWVLINRTEEPPVVDDPNGSVAVLGDSFMAGQGATHFRTGTNSKDVGANMCRRSPVSFASLIGQEFGRDTFDYACNGAETFEIAGTSRADLAPLDGLVASDGKAQLHDVVTAPFAVSDRAAVDVVLVSAGGNDAEFSTVVTTCFLPSDCDDESRRLLTLAAASEGALAATFDAIATTFPATPVVVVPYPSYIGAEACGNAVDDGEVAFANVFIATMNDTIESAVNRSRANEFDVRYFDELDRAYAGRSLCDDERGANFVNLLPPEGPILERITPRSWHEGSAHPTELGHACTAVVLADWMVEQSILPGADRVATLPSCEISDAALADHQQKVDALIARTDAERGGDDWRTPLAADVGFELSDPDDLSSDEVRVVCDTDPCWAVDEWAAERARQLVPALMWRLGLILLGGLLTALAIARSLAGVPWFRALIPDRSTS